MNLKWFFLITTLFFIDTSYARDNNPDAYDEEPDSEIVGPHVKDEPEWPPKSAVIVDFEIIDIQTETAGAVIPMQNPTPEKHNKVSVFDRQEIRTEEEYQAVFGHASENMKWAANRILVLTETTVYKFGELESTSSLSGIYCTGAAIHIGMSFSHYGPCQGIAQQPE